MSKPEPDVSRPGAAGDRGHRSRAAARRAGGRPRAADQGHRARGRCSPRSTPRGAIVDATRARPLRGQRRARDRGAVARRAERACSSSATGPRSPRSAHNLEHARTRAPRRAWSRPTSAASSPVRRPRRRRSTSCSPTRRTTPPTRTVDRRCWPRWPRPGWLAPDARSWSSSGRVGTAVAAPDGLGAGWERTFGDTLVSFCRRARSSSI